MQSWLLLLVLLSIIGHIDAKGPNIIYILVDDVGWADFDYNTKGNTSIPTPNIDRIANEGTKLKSHYTHPTCTPSRAALMTGRYALNTGLIFAMFPGSLAGLPDDMPTMPQLLRKAGYSAHMVGKWHLGHSQWKQTPVGRGFESHTGSMLWDLDSFDKSMWLDPWDFYGLDWVEAHENKTFKHGLNETHATKLQTAAAVKKIEEHKEKENPLFLYVSYTAAHSPLQPDPEYEAKCLHIPHLWRRQFCGLVVGLDAGIGQITKAARENLGEDTIIVVSSDNGGSTLFGGLNQPLRSGKLNQFEGGVRVPAFVHDFSGKYTNGSGKEFHHKMQISDWLPTFLSWAGAKDLATNVTFDGIDQSEALKTGSPARNEVLIDVYTSKDSHDKKNMVAYIKGKYKLIQGDIRDPYYYTEPVADHVQSTDPKWFPRVPYEKFARFLDYLFGERKAEMHRASFMNYFLFQAYAKRIGPQILLFDLENDILEEHNIADEHPEIVKDILETAMAIRNKAPPVSNYFEIYPHHDETIVSGNCTGSGRSSKLCRFIHPWLADDVDLSTVTVVPAERGALIRFIRLILFLASPFIAIAIIIWYICCGRHSLKRILSKRSNNGYEKLLSEKKFDPFAIEKKAALVEEKKQKL